MNFFELIQLVSSNIWLYVGTAIIIFSVLVFVHEWGHYIIARLCGIKVETFSIGFGKEIIGFNDKNGTRWKISLVPLGGYVKLFGDVDPASAQKSETLQDHEAGTVRPLTEEERKVAFFAKPVWQRAIVVFAGPAINYIFAILVLSALFVFNGDPVTPPSAAAVIAGSSAEKYGFKPHDDVLSIDGKSISSFEEIRREMMIGLDQKKHFVIKRDGKTIDIYAKPDKVEEQDRFGFRHSRGLLGLTSPSQGVNIKSVTKVDGKSYKSPDTVRRALLQHLDKSFSVEIKESGKTNVLNIYPLSKFNKALRDPESPDYNILYVADKDATVTVRYAPGVAFVKAVEEAKDVTVGVLQALGQIVVGTRSASELGGVIRIGALAGDMAQQGIIAVIMLTAMLSINLGLINLFPIPLLDGGHLLFYAIEAIRGRPVPDRIQEYAFRFGFAFLIGIMVYANLNDIVQLIL